MGLALGGCPALAGQLLLLSIRIFFCEAFEAPQSSRTISFVSTGSTTGRGARDKETNPEKPPEEIAEAVGVLRVQPGRQMVVLKQI